MAADGSGQIVDIYGRKTGTKLRKGTPLHMYLVGPAAGRVECGGVCRRRRDHPLPSLFDALTFWNAGYRNVTCTFGRGCPDRGSSGRLPEFGIRRVLARAEAVVPRLIAAGIDCYLLALPMGMDVNHTPCKPPIRRRPLERSSARPCGRARAQAQRCRSWTCRRLPAADDDDARSRRRRHDDDDLETDDDDLDDDAWDEREDDLDDAERRPRRRAARCPPRPRRSLPPRRCRPRRRISMPMSRATK